MATVYTIALSGTNTGDAGFTHREFITPLVAGSQGQVRVTFHSAAATSGLKVDHCSIGVASGSGGNTVATPVELTFGGASGFSIAVNSSITSDWVNLNFLSTDNLVVILDLAAAGPDGMAFNSAAVGTDFFHAASASYNLATTPAGSSSTLASIQAVTLIETQGINTPQVGNLRRRTLLPRRGPGTGRGYREVPAPLPAGSDGSEVIVLDAVDDFEEQVIEGATDDAALLTTVAQTDVGTSPQSTYDVLPPVTESFADGGALQPVFADQAEIGLVDSDPGEVEFEASDLTLDGALQPVFGDGPEIVLVDSDAGEVEFEAADFTLDGAIGPVYGDGAEIVALDAEPAPDDEYDVGFFLDEAIGAVFGVGTEIIALDAQDDAEEIVTEGATDDAALFTAATTSDNEQIVVVDAEQPPDDEYDAGLFIDEAVQPVFADQAEIALVASDAGEDEFEAADVAQTGPFDGAAAVATDVPTGPLSIYDLLGQLSGTRLVIPDGTPQELGDNEQIVALEAADDFEEQVTESLSDDGALFPAAAAQTDVPTGPLSIFDVLAQVTDSAHEPILVEPAVTSDGTEVTVVEAVELDPDEYDVGFFLDEALQPVFPDIAAIVALQAEDDFEDLLTDSAQEPALIDAAAAPADITEIVALAAEDDFVEEEGLALFEEKPGFDAAPPPATAKSEWLIRARRRGRR